MRPSLGEADLLLGQKALDQIVRARTAQGITQPVLAVIEAAAGTVNDYTSRYVLDAERWRRLVRMLAVHDLMNFPGGSIPDAVVKARTEALQELKDIRDGKFRDLLLESASAPAVATGAYGSNTPLPIPSNTFPTL
jgi:hypothetical protein